MASVRGMVMGAGFSGDAGKSLERYLGGYLGGGGVFLVGRNPMFGDGPGVVLRSVLKRRVVVVFAPLFVWACLFVWNFFRAGKEECVSLAFGLRTTCDVVYHSSFYTLRMAFLHVYWISFVALFEGPGAVFVPNPGAVLCVFVLGILVTHVFPFLGILVVSSAMLLICWLRVKQSYYIFRWLVFVVLMLNEGFVALVSFFEFLLPVIGGDVTDGEEVEFFDCGEVVPHELLSLEVPKGFCVTSETFFEGRNVGDGMTERQRLLALKGDRFLKTLAAEWLDRNGSNVSFVGLAESFQTDEVFRRWLAGRKGDVGGGKKTRASYVEVLWGEIWELLIVEKIPYRRIWEAFLVFQREIADAEGVNLCGDFEN